MLRLRSARPADRPAALELLSQAHLPTAGVHDHLEQVLLAFEDGQEDGELVGMAGLERHGTAGLLRSVAVQAEDRSSGLGSRLVRSQLERARGLGLSSVSLLTETAADCFPRFGFVPLERSSLPQALQASEELRGACPQRADVLHLTLTPDSHPLSSRAP